MADAEYERGFVAGREAAALVVNDWGDHADEQTFYDPAGIAAEIRALRPDGSDFCSPEFPCDSVKTGIHIGATGGATMKRPYVCWRHQRRQGAYR